MLYIIVLVVVQKGKEMGKKLQRLDSVVNLYNNVLNNCSVMTTV